MGRGEILGLQLYQWTLISKVPKFCTLVKLRSLSTLPKLKAKLAGKGAGQIPTVRMRLLIFMARSAILLPENDSSD